MTKPRTDKAYLWAQKLDDKPEFFRASGEMSFAHVMADADLIVTGSTLGRDEAIAFAKWILENFE